MRWLVLAVGGPRRAASYQPLGRYLPAYLGLRIGVCSIVQIYVPGLGWRDASQAHPRLGPISRISLRLFQLSNPSLRLQKPRVLIAAQLATESTASQLLTNPPVLSLTVSRADAPR